MTRTKELDGIAEGIVDVTIELLYDTIDGQLSNFPEGGEDVGELYEYVAKLVIKKMYDRGNKCKTYTTPYS